MHKRKHISGWWVYIHIQPFLAERIQIEHTVKETFGSKIHSSFVYPTRTRGSVVYANRQSEKFYLCVDGASHVHPLWNTLAIECRHCKKQTTVTPVLRY